VRRLILVAGIAALAGCGAVKAPIGITVEVSSSPFRVSILQDGRTIVAEDKAARLRFEVAPNNYEYSLTHVISSRGHVYRVATTEPGRTATVIVRPTTTGADIAVSLHPATNVTEVYDAFDTGPDDHFLGGGERGQAVDLRGQIAPVKVDYNCSYAPIPFFSSSAGWGIRLATENVSSLAFPGSAGGSGCQSSQGSTCSFPPLTDYAEVCEQSSQLDENLYVGSFAQVLADYEAEAGPPAVPPKDELALIKWRDQISGPDDVLQDISRLQAAKIPLGWVLVDNPWEGCNGELTFDKSLIPDPESLISAVHARGVRFMLWVSPLATCSQGYPGKPLGSSARYVLDLRRPDVVAEFERRIRALVKLGIDGVKADRGDEVDLEAVAPGLTNTYPLLYAHAVMDALPKGAAAIFRAGTVGSAAVVPGLWAGDQPEEFVGLQRAIVSGETAGVSGFPTWGSDIGGYAGPPYVTADLFVRWAQLGAVSPVMEVGGQGQNATPWTLGSDAMAGLRAAAVLHYELFPYLYGLLARHQPVIEPLGYAYPADPRSWGATYEFLVGPSLLAAPVTGPGTTPSVYLPPGKWVDLYAGTVVKGGGRAFTRPTPLDELPLYARAGAVIPFNLRTATRSWWSVNDLTRPGRVGFLATNGARLDLTGQPAHVQVFVPAARRPGRVTIGGHVVSWRWNAGPLPGVVIRLRGPAVQGRILVS
jgi:alpha-D-xyloside xylohydrolase